MPVVIALAAVAVLAAVVVLAMGRGGELAEARLDRPPAMLPWNRPIEATDIALLRLPPGLWGYHIGTTDEVLTQLAQTLGERATRIAVLERELAALRARLEAVGQEDRPEVTWEPAHQPPGPWPPPGGTPPAGPRPAGPPQQWGQGPGQVVFGPYGTSDYLDTDR